MPVARTVQPVNWWTHPWLLGGVALLVSCFGMAMIVRQQPLLGVAVVVAPLVGLALLSRVEALIPLGVFLLFTNAAVIATHFHGAPAAFGLAPLVLLAVPAAQAIVLRGQKVIVNQTLVFFFCLFVIQVLGALLAIRPAESADELITWLVEGLALYLLVTNAVRTPEQLRMAIWALLAAGGFIGGISAYQQFTGAFDNNFLGFAQVSDASFSAEGLVESRQPRLAGPIGEKNRYAQFMALLIPISLFQFWAEGARSLRLLALVSLLLTSIGFALAFSRGAAVGVALAFLVLMAMGYFRWSHLVLVCIAAIVTGLAAPQYSARLESLGEIAASLTRPGGAGVGNTDGATRGRLTAMTSAVLAFADHPVIGVGPGMNRRHYRHYARVVGGRISTADRRAHSLYPGLAAEHGLLGLAAFGAILFTTFRGLNRARRRWRRGRPDLEKMTTGLEAALIVYLTSSIFLHLAYIRYFWLIMGLAGAAAYLGREAEAARARGAPAPPGPRP